MTDVAAYRALPRESYSSLKYLLISAKHFKANKEKPVTETPAMRIGTAVDEAVLSGIRKTYAIMPPEIAALEGEGSRKAQKAWKDSQKAAGVEIVKSEDVESQNRMIRALDESSEFQELLKIMPERQKPILFCYRGIELKCLLDMAGHDANGKRCFGDLKTSLSASPEGFGRLAYNRDYDLQCRLYQIGLAMSERLDYEPLPCWAVVENSDAAPVSLFEIPAEYLESGQRKLDLCIDRLLRIRETGEYAGYGSGWQTPVFPRYAATLNHPEQ